MHERTNTREHWQRAYTEKRPTDVSWFAEHLVDSTKLILDVAAPSSRIVDVGGGASTLVDDLLAHGLTDVTVLDVSEAALAISRARLGARADDVRWLVADITSANVERDRYDVWHDRAVFHFLTALEDRRAYRERLESALTVGGHAVFATFAPNGPTRCSALDVRRYDAQALADELGERFVLETHATVTHTTPAGKPQEFTFSRFAKRA